MQNIKELSQEIHRNRLQVKKLHEENKDNLSEASLHIESVLLSDFLELEESMHKRFNKLENLMLGIAEYIIEKDPDTIKRLKKMI